MNEVRLTEVRLRFFAWMVCAIALAVLVRPARALTPAEVFEKVSPSVWMVRSLDGQERPFSLGSAVVIEKSRMVTNCHVLAKAKAVQVRHENVTFDAKLAAADVERDLCILAVAGLSAPAVEIADMSTVKVGNRAYVVGNPEGLSLTLSEGLISSLRPEIAPLPTIQTSAPISPGSSGGGLFDDQGRLVGITQLIFLGRDRLGQNLNFALPAQWIRAVPKRAKEQLARYRGGTSGAAPAATPAESPALALGGLPRAGTSWRYRVRDQKYGQQYDFTARVTAVYESRVDEYIGIGDAAGLNSATDAEKLRFTVRKIAGRTLVELSPYYLPAHAKVLAETYGTPEGYPVGFSAEPFEMKIESIRQEEVTVPLGTFKALRIEVSGVRTLRGFAGMGGRATDRISKFRFIAWYAPGISRYVKAEHMQWAGLAGLTADEVIQLQEYKAN